MRALNSDPSLGAVVLGVHTTAPNEEQSFGGVSKFVLPSTSSVYAGDETITHAITDAAKQREFWKDVALPFHDVEVTEPLQKVAKTESATSVSSPHAKKKK